MHCDYNINGVVHGACCYCAEHWDYADARFILFDGRRLWFISVCRCNDYVCCNIICYDTNNYLCIYNHRIHIATHVSCC